MLLLGCEAAPEPVPLDGFITDAEGRALILHGANVSNSTKSSPERLPDLIEDDARRMSQDWGFDFVRYLILWDAVEPEPGVYDDAWLDAVEVRLDWFAAHDIFVLLDMHQDVYSSVFCCDGAPAWAVRDDGEPFELQSQWFRNYTQPAVLRAFDNFWDYEGAHSDLQDHYAAAWAHVAQRLGSHPAVIGYDVMNEPHPGSAWDGTELFGEQQGEDGPVADFDRERLAPFYQRVIDAIREVESERWVFVEPRYGTPGNGSRSWLPQLADPRDGAPRIVNAPHMYSVLLEAGGAYPGEDASVANWERARHQDVVNGGGPMVIGEWGLDWNAAGSDRFMDDLLDVADRAFAGWAYWSFDGGSWGFWQPATETESANLEHLVRAYPQRIAGEPTELLWEREARRMTLRWREVGIAAETVVYVPEARFYPNGFDVELSDGTSSWDAERELLSVSADPSVGEHSLVISPR